jgi:hypothetical protein
MAAYKVAVNFMVLNESSSLALELKGIRFILTGFPHTILVKRSSSLGAATAFLRNRIRLHSTPPR